MCRYVLARASPELHSSLPVMKCTRVEAERLTFLGQKAAHTWLEQAGEVMQILRLSTQ